MQCEGWRVLLCYLSLICVSHFQSFLFSGVDWCQMFTDRRTLAMNTEDRGVWWVLGCTAHVALRKDELPWLWGALSGEILPLSAPAGIASAAESILAQGHSLPEAAHPMAAQDRGTKACIPWGRLRSLCSLPHVLIPKVFSNQHPEPKASEDHFEFVYSLQRQHVFHLGVPPPPSEGQGHTLPPFNASISPLDHVAGCCLLRGAGVSVFSLHAASPR